MWLRGMRPEAAAPVDVALGQTLVSPGGDFGIPSLLTLGILYVVDPNHVDNSSLPFRLHIELLFFRLIYVLLLSSMTWGSRK